MNIQYHFELVFLRLKLKRNVLSESNLKITLIQSHSKQQSASLALQSEEIKIKKNQKIIDLDSIKTFNFSSNGDEIEKRFTIKYDIKGNGEDRVRSIPINPNKMIEEYQNTSKHIFQESFGGENAQLTFKFYLTKTEQEQEKVDLLVNAESKEGRTQSQENAAKMSNSISRNKRPPNLNFVKRSSTSPLQKKESQQKIKHYGTTAQDNLLTIVPDVRTKGELTLNSYESHNEDNNSSIIGMQKKISSLPLSEIEKVNQLIATHHRPHEGHNQHPNFSYKIKIVVIMLIIGVAFLLIDTLSDRKSRKPKKIAHNSHGNSHPSHNDGNSHASHNDGHQSHGEQVHDVQEEVKPIRKKLKKKEESLKVKEEGKVNKQGKTKKGVPKAQKRKK